MKSFRIRNIKSFEDSGVVELKPITIFVGKNSCGKSSLLRFPAVIAQTFQSNTDSPIKFYGQMVDYGNYEDVAHKGNNDKISFSMTYDINVKPFSSVLIRRAVLRNTTLEELRQSRSNPDYREATLQIDIYKEGKNLIVNNVTLIVLGKEIYKISRIKKRAYEFQVNYIYSDGNFIEEQHSVILNRVEFEKFIPIYSDRERFHIIAERVYGKNRLLELNTIDLDTKIHRSHVEGGVLSEEEKVIAKEEFAFDYAADLLRNFYDQLETSSHYLHYIGPFRQNPDRVYRDPEFQSGDIGVKGENLSNMLISDYHRNQKLIKKISDSLKEILGYTLSLKNIGSGLYQIMIEDEQGYKSNIIDTGYGVSQVLPIVAQIIRSMFGKNRSYRSMHVNEVILIEQPELHLHPAAQAEIAKLFVDCVTKSNNMQLILETHSEHLIRKLQVMIADKKCPFTSEMIKIYYIDKDENGVASVDEMKLLPNGKFYKKWPSGFFDKGFLLSVELANASR